MQNFRTKLQNTAELLKLYSKKKNFWIIAAALSLCGVILFIELNLKTVYIRDGVSTIKSHTLKNDPDDILSNEGIAIMAFDVVDFTGFEGKMGVIDIKRAFPVTLVCDGSTKKVMTPEVSVRELLHNEGIILGPADELSIPKTFYLSEGDKVVVTRVEKQQEVVREAVPFKTEYIKTPLLRNNRVRVLSYGSEGEKELTLEHTFEDGKIVSTEVLEEEILSEPVVQKVLVGADVPASNLDFGIELDANGNPVHYKQVLRNQVCTGYSSPTGYRYKGASGMRLEAGCVAVRANQIPYGTKLYIKSPDGSFIYGCAVAADTGSGLMQNVIDIDLYYETYKESCLNGRKYLDVYIL